MQIQYLFILISLFLGSCQVGVVKQGEHGVLFKRFDGGVDTTTIYKPGKYTFANWNYIITYDTEDQSYSNEITVFEENVYEVVINYEYVIKVRPEKVGKLHYYIGDNYNNITKSFLSKEIYIQFKDLPEKVISDSQKKELETSIINTVKENVGHDFTEIKSFKLTKITFN